VIEASGVYAIAATPFHDDGRIDEVSTARMVEFYRGCGVTGLTILGVMGEAAKLDTEEAVGFARRVIGECGAMPVIVGASPC
jgi:4-hydroxy-tetrahydrodipicolinate synthase